MSTQTWDALKACLDHQLQSGESRHRCIRQAVRQCAMDGLISHPFCYGYHKEGKSYLYFFGIDKADNSVIDTFSLFGTDKQIQLSDLYTFKTKIQDHITNQYACEDISEEIYLQMLRSVQNHYSELIIRYFRLFVKKARLRVSGMDLEQGYATFCELISRSFRKLLDALDIRDVRLCLYDDDDNWRVAISCYEREDEVQVSKVSPVIYYSWDVT